MSDERTELQILDHSPGEVTGGCELCGSVEELRPYGPYGTWVCFDCGMRDEESTRKQFGKLLDSAEVTILKT